MTMNRTAWFAAPLAVLALAACQGGENGKAGSADPAAATTPEPSNRSIADSLAGRLKDLVKTSGLSPVLEGVGPYTVFAPSDDALASLGDMTKDEAMRAQGVALLRAHIVPGALTRADINAAVDRGGADGARMITMAGDVLTFKKDGDALVVSAADGATAHLTGDQSLASNGVIQPVDGLLVKPAARPAS